MSFGAENFTAADRRALAARGVTPEEAAAQLARLAAPPAYAVLDRPCTIGDGIVRLASARFESLLAAHAAAAAAGRVGAFVPASGAATRMFKDLLAARSLPGDIEPAAVLASATPEARALAAWVDGLPRLAHRDALAAALAARGLDAEALRRAGPWRPLLEALLAPEGLDCARAPKALLAFHRTPAGPRTAFEEHLAEAAEFSRDSHGRCRLHFTVSPEHRAGFEALLAEAGARQEAATGSRFEVSFSEQHPATDTLAADLAGGPFRDASGALLFRPAGHGALLRNLAGSDGDLVFVKNIDNVATDRFREETLRWSRALTGLAAELAAGAAAHAARLAASSDDAGALAAARAFLAEAFGDAVADADHATLRARLERPVRVCGMVPNTGEPGGGPFWVRDAGGGVTRQVVESAQVAPAAAQQEVLRSATHFNPVFLACALRDGAGRAHDLARFVDEDAVIVTRKSSGGRDLLALERPGLWNGAMARWNTVFVEVPLAVFNPVKTVLDLLRPAHQGA